MLHSCFNVLFFTILYGRNKWGQVWIYLRQLDNLTKHWKITIYQKELCFYCSSLHSYLLIVLCHCIMYVYVTVLCMFMSLYYACLCHCIMYVYVPVLCMFMSLYYVCLCHCIMYVYVIVLCMFMSLYYACLCHCIMYVYVTVLCMFMSLYYVCFISGLFFTLNVNSLIC
jgi:hypothetical protein